MSVQGHKMTVRPSGDVRRNNQAARSQRFLNQFVERLSNICIHLILVCRHNHKYNTQIFPVRREK